MKLNIKNRIILLFLYGVIMFFTIRNEINILLFFMLFVITPFLIYYFVKMIFPKKLKWKKNLITYTKIMEIVFFGLF